MLALSYVHYQPHNRVMRNDAFTDHIGQKINKPNCRKKAQVYLAEQFLLRFGFFFEGGVVYS